MQSVFSFEFQNSLNMMNDYCVFSHDPSHFGLVSNLGAFLKLMHHQACSTLSKSFEFYFKLWFIWFIRFQIMEKYSFSIFICMEILNQLKSIWILKFPFDVIEVCHCYIQVKSSKCLDEHSWQKLTNLSKVDFSLTLNMVTKIILNGLLFSFVKKSIT